MSYASTIRTHHRDAVHFMNTTVFKPLPDLPESFLSGRACATPHFYDGLTLMTKHWNWFNADALGILRGKYWSIVQGLRVGEASIRKCIQEQLGVLKEDTRESIGNYPTLIGEIGCPFDQDGKKAYGYVDGGKGKGDYSQQQRSWDASMNATDGPNTLSYTFWNYTPTSSHQWGDGWNGEDLSIWNPDDCKGATYKMQSSLANFSAARSLDESTASTLLSTSSSQTLRPRMVSPKGIESGDEVTAELLLDGTRAISAVCRPYPVYTVGAPTRIDFDIASTSFKLEVTVNPDDGGDGTVIYVPFVHYARDMDWTPTPSSKQVDDTGSDVSSRVNSTSSLLDGDEPAGTLKPHALSSQPLRLAIDVKVSAGEYTTAGQYLTWRYPIPATRTVYTLEIRRTKGVMAHNVLPNSGGWGGMLASFGCTIA